MDNIITLTREKILSSVWNFDYFGDARTIDTHIKKVRQKLGKYGDYIISSLSTKLVLEFGNGYSIQNLKRMRKFYLCFPISSTVSSQLCWSHYTELINIFL